MTWYSIGQINYSREQLLTFLLPNLNLLRLDDWPYRESGYQDEREYRQHKEPCARYRALDIAIEIDYRLSKCDTADIVYSLAVNFEEELEVARRYKMSEDDMNKEFNRVIGYISGFKRKPYTFTEYKFLRLVERNMRRAVIPIYNI